MDKKILEQELIICNLQAYIRDIELQHENFDQRLEEENTIKGKENQVKLLIDMWFNEKCQPMHDHTSHLES